MWRTLAYNYHLILQTLNKLTDVAILQHMQINQQRLDLFCASLNQLVSHLEAVEF